MMKINIFFCFFIVLYLIQIGVSLARHGKTKIEKENFWTTLFASIIGITMLYFAIKTSF